MISTKFGVLQSGFREVSKSLQMDVGQQVTRNTCLNLQSSNDENENKVDWKIDYYTKLKSGTIITVWIGKFFFTVLFF